MRTGLAGGDQLVTTPLGQVSSGTRVRISGAGSDRTASTTANSGEAG